MKKKLAFSFVLLLIAGFAFGCDGEQVWEDGTYQASAEGYNDDIVLEVVIDGGEIIEINILEHEETPRFAEDAFDTVIPDIIEAQSADVDSVSGATATADAVIEAVKKALADAEN